MEKNSGDRLKILVVFPNLPLWGQERANIETLWQLQKRGAQVRFLIRREWSDQAIQPELISKNLDFRFMATFDALRHGISFHAHLKNIFGIFLGSITLLKQIKAFNATHVHAGATFAVINVLPALVLSRIPLVYRAGDMPPSHHWLWRIVWAFTCKRAAVFVCDSHFIRKKLISLGAPAARCEVIYAPPPHRHDTEEQCSIIIRQLEALSPPKGLTFLYVGQISQEKGVDRLIDATMALMAEGWRFRLMLAGDWKFRNPFGQALVDMVASADLSSQIIFLGYASSVSPIFSIADVHVAPSVWQEPYGLTVLEAKSHGIPSIVFPSGALQETVIDQQEGFVCAEPSTMALKQAMETYLTQPELIKQQGEKARLSLESRLGVQNYGARWNEVYDKTRYANQYG